MIHRERLAEELCQSYIYVVTSLIVNLLRIKQSSDTLTKKCYHRTV